MFSQHNYRETEIDDENITFEKLYKKLFELKFSKHQFKCHFNKFSYY
jgi:hypothetical protein